MTDDLQDLLPLLVDAEGKPLPLWANLTLEEVAKAEGVHPDTLQEQHARGGDEAPPRYRTSRHKWGCPPKHKRRKAASVAADQQQKAL